MASTALDQRALTFDNYVETISNPAQSPLLQHLKLPAELRVCVIGASTGIGEHIAYAYAAAGVANITIGSRDKKDLESVAQRIRELSPGSTTQILSIDIGKDESVADLANFLKTTHGALDVVVLNAGHSNPNANICEASPEAVRTAFAVNAMGTYSVIYHLAPLLIRQKQKSAGLFLTIGSGSSALRRGPFANPGYSISKLAQARMVEYLSEKFAEDELVSINIEPGTVLTQMSRTLIQAEYTHCTMHHLYPKVKVS